jgi:GH25 family lysozyme M1 (1,4-beta-N-acetylmuramidase)
MIPGVDRSHLNAKIPLQSLADRGIKFIWFKATQALTFEDPTFNAAWQEAKAINGVARGCYHFFDPRVDGTAQAEHYIGTGVNFKAAGCLMPCVDVEDLTGNNAAEANQWVADNYLLAIERLTDFLQYVMEQTGRPCLIYTYNNYPKEYFRGHGFPNNPMWLSSLQATCPSRYDNGRQPEFWQWSYNWENTDMDANYFTGNQEQLNILANIT